MNTKTEFTLWYGTTFLGRIRDAFMSDATWFGIFEPKFDPTNNQLVRWLADFIEFSEEFYEHDPDSEDSPDPVTQFKRFSDVTETGQWSVQTSAGDKHSLLVFPTIFKGGEISWREG